MLIRRETIFAVNDLNRQLLVVNNSWFGLNNHTVIYALTDGVWRYAYSNRVVSAKKHKQLDASLKEVLDADARLNK